jgi:membrane protein
MKNALPLLDFFRTLYGAWISERPSQLAAAIAYYGLFSIAPIIFIGYTIANPVIKQLTEYSHFYVRLENALGPEVAKSIRDSVDALGGEAIGGSALVSTISFLALLFAASGMFFQIQFALNSIFKVQGAGRNRTRAFILQRLFSFLMVIGVGLLAILAVLLNFAVAWVGSLLGDLLGTGATLFVLDGLTMFAITTLAFALIYKILPDVDISWRDVWLGAALAALLALLAGALLGTYFRYGGVGSAFEAAGSFAVILIAINIFAQIFLFGALFTREYTLRYGSGKKLMEKSEV